MAMSIYLLPVAFSGPLRGFSIFPQNISLVLGMFSGYSQRFIPAYMGKRKNNGLNSGCEAHMSKGHVNNVLHKMSEGYIIEDRMIDGQEGSLLFALSPLARQIASEGGAECLEITILIRWMPEGYSDRMATTYDERGVIISRV